MNHEEMFNFHRAAIRDLLHKAASDDPMLKVLAALIVLLNEADSRRVFDEAMVTDTHHCHRINHECHQHHGHHEPQLLRDLSLTVKVLDSRCEVWTVIKHEPELRRMKLRKDGPGMHPEWDAPEDLRVTLEQNGPGPQFWRLHDERQSEDEEAIRDMERCIADVRAGERDCAWNNLMRAVQMLKESHG